MWSSSLLKGCSGKPSTQCPWTAPGLVSCVRCNLRSGLCLYRSYSHGPYSKLTERRVNKVAIVSLRGIRGRILRRLTLRRPASHFVRDVATKCGTSDGLMGWWICLSESKSAAGARAQSRKLRPSRSRRLHTLVAPLSPCIRALQGWGELPA